MDDSKAAEAARRAKTPDEYYEGDYVPDIADVMARYSPAAAEADKARKDKIERVMAQARALAPTLKFVVITNNMRAIKKRLSGEKVIKNVQKVDAAIKTLDAAFADPTSQLINDIVVWRGLSKQFAENLDKAKGFVDNAYPLVSTVERPLALCARITIKAGTPVVYLAPHLPQAALLKRGSTFTVTDVIDLPNTRTYHLRMEG